MSRGQPLNTGTKLDRVAVQSVAVFCFLIVLGTVGRLGSYWYGAWNFTPVAAIGLFAGFYFSRQAVALFVPLAVLVFSNIVIGSYESASMQVVVYGSFLLPVAISSVLRRKLSATRVGLCALSSSALFFLATNMGHWWFMRAHSATELFSTYVDALPFFRATVAGDLFWSFAIFGSYGLATWTGYMPRRERARVFVKP